MRIPQSLNALADLAVNDKVVRPQKTGKEAQD